MWHPFDEGSTLGTDVSEGGFAIRDEEHERGARISLERDAKAAPFAITCGIYGWMVHTTFLSDVAEAQEAFDQMKRDLERILEMIPIHNDPAADEKIQLVQSAISAFVGKH